MSNKGSEYKAFYLICITTYHKDSGYGGEILNSRPKVTIIWVNYNSSHFIKLALESLESIANQTYPNYELIVVDNASTDNSFHVIKDFVEKLDIESKIVRLEKNLGFTGANNLAYRIRDARSRYVVLLNNDATMHPDTVHRMVELMEKDNSIGALQGIILDYNRERVRSAGIYLSEMLGIYLYDDHRFIDAFKPIAVSAVDGANCIYRINAIKECNMHGNTLFDEYLFAQYDDVILGLRLWQKGFKVLCFPFIAAKHLQGASFGKLRPLKHYLYLRNITILNEISNSRYKPLIRFLLLRNIRYENKGNISKVRLKAFSDGVKLARKISKKENWMIDIYRAPIIRIPVSIAVRSLIVRRVLDNYVINKLKKLNDNINF